jgi:hypothetical protein
MAVAPTTQTIQANVGLSKTAPASISVRYVTVENDGALAFDSYVPTSGTLVFAPGKTLLPINVTILPKTGARATVKFALQLSQPVGATLGRTNFDIFLQDNLLSSLINYLLGIHSNPAGLDINADTKVNVADAVKRVGQLPPTSPTAPHPGNASPNAPLSTVLGWDASARATSYDVFLWQAAKPRPDTPTTSGLVQPAYDPPGKLIAEMTYRWQVVARGTGGTTTGPIWSFTTGAGPEIAVDLPDAKTVGAAGGAMRIQWKLALDAGTSCRFELWHNGAKIKDLGTGFSPSGDGDATLMIPAALPADDYQLRIVSTWLETNGQSQPYIEMPIVIGK